MIDGRDRKRLERLCRYMARPPVCQERLAVTESGQVVVRYHGVLAARAAIRSEVVPGAAPEQREPIQLRLAFDGDATPLELELKPASRHPWAWLLARVFAVDVMTCSRCGGRMRLVEIADSRDGIARMLVVRGSRPAAAQ